MDNNNKRYIYFHKNLETNEVFYIGQGTRNRAYQTKGRNVFWCDYTKKYPNYQVIIKYTDLTLDIADLLEIKLISIYGRRILNEGSLTNITEGGKGTLGFKGVLNPNFNRKFTNHHRKKISNALKGKKHTKEHIEKNRLSHLGQKPHNLGKKHSEHSKKKMRESALNRIVSDETKLKQSKKRKGSNNSNSKLNENDVKYIRKNYIKGINSQNTGNSKQLCEMFNISKSTFERIVTNKSWKHII